MQRLECLLLALALDAAPGEEAVDWFEQLDAMSRGDLVALARLRRLVTAQLMRLGAYRARAVWDDLAQEVLTRVWRAHRDGKIREAQGVPAFVRTTTRNAFIDWTRRHHREVDVEDDALLAAHDTPSDERALDEPTRRLLTRAVEALEQRHRDVIDCLYLKGLSYDETSRRLDRPRGTVNRLQREAMAQLRTQLLAGEADDALAPQGQDSQGQGGPR